MSMHSGLEVQLITVLKAAPGLASIKTFEAEIKDALFVGDKLSQGFTSGALPAINLSMNLTPTKSSQFTAGEKRYDVPLTVVVITSSGNLTTARDNSIEYAFAVEAALNDLRRSGNPLGRNILLTGDISVGAASVVHEKPMAFAWVSIEATISVVVTL